MKKIDKIMKKMIYLAVWLVCMAAAVYFCMQKSGFHSDEYYSYYTTELTKGLNVPENSWMQHDDYYDEFRVLKGEGFRYGLVKQVQSWDVHPPMYYWVLHTVCSLFPGTFTKWTGLGINLVFHGISLWLIMYLTNLLLEAMSRYGMKRKSYTVDEDNVVTSPYNIMSMGNDGTISGKDSDRTGGRTSDRTSGITSDRTSGRTNGGMHMHFIQEIKEFLPAFVMASWGLSPESISEVTFIRMYSMLTMLVLLTIIVHIRQMMRPQTDKLPIMKFVVPAAILTYVGFMTHYYYVVFLFFVAFFFWIWRIHELKCGTGKACVSATLTNRSVYKDVITGDDREAEIQAGDAASVSRISGIFGRIFEYPIVLVSPLILGYLTYPSCLGQIFRGQRGTQAIGSFADTTNTFDRFRFFGDVFGRLSFGGLLAIWILITVLLIAAAHVQKVSISELWCPECVMTLITSVFYFLIVSKTGLLLGDQSIRYLMPIAGISVMIVLIYLTCLSEKMKMRISTGAFAAAFIALDIVGLYKGDVQFLYKEDRTQISFAEEHKDIPVIYLYDSAQKWCIWDSADELFEYPEVYFADRAQVEEAADKDSDGLGSDSKEKTSESSESDSKEKTSESSESDSKEKTSESSESDSKEKTSESLKSDNTVESSGTGIITDKKITEASSLVVYVARCDDETTALRGIMNSSGLDDYEKQYSDTYCDVYLFK